MSIDVALARRVRTRARHCCEYCRLPEQFSSIAFEIDHVIAEQHGGETVSKNLALACFADNHHKGPNLAGIDDKTGRRAWLFNPPVGRATIAVLQINSVHRVAQRAALIAEGVFPPK
jgi:5-methylcytosine-specific restriction endonuclease McrA